MQGDFPNGFLAMFLCQRECLGKVFVKCLGVNRPKSVYKWQPGKVLPFLTQIVGKREARQARFHGSVAY